MNSKISKRLHKIAKDLPVYPDSTPGHIKKYGTELLADGVTHIEDGSPVAEEGVYIAKVPRIINHETKLKAAYISGGDKAVQLYVAQAHKKAAEPQKAKNQNISQQKPEFV